MQNSPKLPGFNKLEYQYCCFCRLRMNSYRSDGDPTSITNYQLDSLCFTMVFNDVELTRLLGPELKFAFFFCKKGNSFCYILDQYEQFGDIYSII